VLIFDANANPPQHAREPRPPVEVHRKHRKQHDKRGEGGAKTRPVARLSATRRSSRRGRRNTQQQPCREKRGDHHSPMKHSKRRMLGAMVKAGGSPPSAQGRPPGALPRRGKQLEERARRTEMRKEPAPIQRRDV